MKDAIKNVKRVVIKVGTSTLTHKSGSLNIRRVEKLTRVLSDLKNSGLEIILVSSGAIAVGVAKLGLLKKPTDTPTKQACAAIGQCELMYVYDKAFSEYNHNVAQVLLTKDVIDNNALKENAVNTFDKILLHKVIPIVNENDTISVDELVIGDNDTLSAIVATLVKADFLIILTDQDGLYTANPKDQKDAQLISIVNKIDDYICSIAGGKGTELGTGGMQTKIQAAKVSMDNNIPMLIINGENPDNLYSVFDGNGIGTLFTDKKGW